jgi:AcrR family transcriptional regulator
VLDAARALFVERGYAAATIEAVAERAEVSPETVYSVVRQQARGALRPDRRDDRGDDAPVPILERPWIDAMRTEPDPRRRLRILARNGRLMLDRWADVAVVLASAAAADPKIAELWERNKEQRLTGQRVLLHNRDRRRDSGGMGSLARRRPTSLFAVGSPEVYRTLVVRSRVSPARSSGGTRTRSSGCCSRPPRTCPRAAAQTELVALGPPPHNTVDPSCDSTLKASSNTSDPPVGRPVRHEGAGRHGQQRHCEARRALIDTARAAR